MVSVQVQIQASNAIPTDPNKEHDCLNNGQQTLENTEDCGILAKIPAQRNFGMHHTDE
jgi:hypothetical protein